MGPRHKGDHLERSSQNPCIAFRRDFVFKPTQSRRYTIATLGGSDTLLALFEQVDGEPRFVAGDDDSGEDRNASIRQKLFSGRTYVVRLRLYYPGETGTTAVMVS